MIGAGPNLIYDIGVHDGDDSAYYLHKGYRVVGVEANPLAIPGLETRFEAELGDGRYVLLPIGIAETDGAAEFWVCDDQPKWSSFDPSIASRNGARHHPVKVQSRRFGSVLEEFGAAACCKIDIEGNDDLCLEDLTPATRPEFISVELNKGDLQLARLSHLGYSKFKIIFQRTFRQEGPRGDTLRARLPRPARRLFRALEARLASHSPEPAWRFVRGSSGPFGEDTHGEWRTLPEAQVSWTRIAGRGADLSEWHDIHAHCLAGELAAPRSPFAFARRAARGGGASFRSSAVGKEVSGTEIPD